VKPLRDGQCDLAARRTRFASRAADHDLNISMPFSGLARLDERQTALATVLVGVILGVLVTISSAGAVGVVALIIVYPNVRMARVVAADIAHAVPLTLVAGAGHWLVGTVDWHIVGWLLAGSPGIVLDSCLAVRVPETALRPLLAAPLVVVAGKRAYDHIESGSTLVTAFTRHAPH
jgi:uncharacterized membrane protein YfcA